VFRSWALEQAQEFPPLSPWKSSTFISAQQAAVVIFAPQFFHPL
jgi:hypothetical protein